jgi:HisA/HisF family protein
MQIIPVIDIMGGVAVRAIRGERRNYLPISTPLSETSRPDDVIEGYLRLHPFETFYVADLDAIEGARANRAALAGLMKFSPRTFWIDAGARTRNLLHESRPSSPFEGVIGSETLSSLSEWRALAHQRDLLLSLDFRDGKFEGPAGLLEEAELWPNRVIVMALARVGTADGPDLDLLSAIIRRAKGRSIFAAGGVRGAEDLKALADAGAAGALVASALHSGALSAPDLQRIAA